MGSASVTIDEALNGITSLYVETAPFIYFVEKHPVYIQPVRAIFQHIAPESMHVITSTITIAEVLTMPIKLGQQDYLQAYRDMLLNTEAIAVRSVDSAIAERAAQLRATYGLRTPDALHLATAQSAQCQAFLTNDRALKRVAEVNVLVIDELLVSSD